MKTKFSRRILAFVLMLALVVPMFVFNANAADESASLSFASTTQRTSFSTTKQVWAQNGIEFTNEKASSSNAVADYSNPVRLYQGSSITIKSTLGNITKIEFTASSSSYATALKDAISGSSVNGSKVTVNLDGTSDTFKVAKLTAQVRLNSLTVHYIAASDDLTFIEDLNDIESKMSLAYRYEANYESVVVEGGVTDVLNQSVTGITGSSYTDWSGKTSNSDAVYAGQCAGSNQSIQLRSDNSKGSSGVITTASGGTVKKIIIKFSTATTTGRTVDIYGKNSAYGSTAELYDASAQGTKLGSIVCGTSTTLEVSGEYAYIGLRSNSGALYIESLSIVWDDGSADSTENQLVYKNSQFAFRFAVDAALTEIDGIDSYGIKVSASGKEAFYSTDAKSWTVQGGYAYVTVELGDIINDLGKLSTEFKVQAFVEYDGSKFVSENVTKYSVVSIIAHYCDNLGYEEVTHLYDYLANNDLI